MMQAKSIIVQLLLLSQKKPQLDLLEQTRFERRFRWTNESGALQANWQDYAKEMGTTVLTVDRISMARYHLKQAEVYLTKLAQPVG